MKKENIKMNNEAANFKGKIAIATDDQTPPYN